MQALHDVLGACSKPLLKLQSDSAPLSTVWTAIDDVQSDLDAMRKAERRAKRVGSVKYKLCAEGFRLFGDKWKLCKSAAITTAVYVDPFAAGVFLFSVARLRCVFSSFFYFM